MNIPSWFHIDHYIVTMSLRLLSFQLCYVPLYLYFVYVHMHVTYFTSAGRITSASSLLPPRKQARSSSDDNRNPARITPTSAIYALDLVYRTGQCFDFCATAIRTLANGQAPPRGRRGTMSEERLWKFRRPEWMNSSMARSAGVYAAGGLVCVLLSVHTQIYLVLWSFDGERELEGQGRGPSALSLMTTATPSPLVASQTKPLTLGLYVIEVKILTQPRSSHSPSTSSSTQPSGLPAPSTAPTYTSTLSTGFP